MRKSSAAAGTFMPGYSLAHSGSSSSSGPGSSTAPESACAPTVAAFSSTHTLTSGFFCLRRMAQASPAGPAPTITTSYCMTSRSIASVDVLDSLIAVTRRPRLLRLHADRAVQADGLTVEHRDLEHARHELREFLRPAEARGERHLRGERVLHVLGHPVHHGGVEDTRRDRHAADAEARQLARDWQRHAGHARFGGRVSRLAYPPLEGSDRGGMNQHPALPVVAGGVVLHDVGGRLVAEEGADQVDVDHLGEELTG